jgi:hypothetical protein
MKQVSFVASALLLAVAVTLVGCTEAGPARTPVKGTVKADGKAVDGGNLVFVPVTSDPSAPSPPATAAIKSDGTFEVTGGVVAGKHKIMYEAPHIPSDVQWDGKGTPPVTPKSPFAGMTPKQAEVEVTAAGANDLAVELVTPGGA